MVIHMFGHVVNIGKQDGNCTVTKFDDVLTEARSICRVPRPTLNFTEYQIKIKIVTEDDSETKSGEDRAR